jgi:pilus assembly protein CpaF
MEARLPGPDGTGEVNIGMMIRASLRMRPDRIIVGEVRGKESADLLSCLTSGHPGSMSTGHSNSCLEMMERLTAMILSGSSLPYDAILSQVSMGINIVLHIMRSREGKRYIDEICEVMPPSDHEYRLKTLYRNKGGNGLERIAGIEDIKSAMAYRA